MSDKSDLPYYKTLKLMPDCWRLITWMQDKHDFRRQRNIKRMEPAMKQFRQARRDNYRRVQRR